MLGFKDDGEYHLGCAVIPMGWSSAVSIMQEIADRLTVISRLPLSHQVRKSVPLPPWLVQTLRESEVKERAWYHVYLDNFCAMEKIEKSKGSNQGREFHLKLEEGWQKVGVLSSAKKRVADAGEVEELGALISGDKGYMGASEMRLLKLIQLTLVVLCAGKLKKKWVQVVAGRWVHVMSFRRPGMMFLNEVWKWIAEPRTSFGLERKVRSELFGCCCGCLLLHTDLRSKISKITTASDASSSGGAVGVARNLSEEGQEFSRMDRAMAGKEVRAPILVLSLFNGIGCCFRCYDLCGVAPLHLVSYEICKEANRITSRRWPQAEINLDVKDLTEEVIRKWRYKFPQLEEIHIWGGFPALTSPQ